MLIGLLILTTSGNIDFSGEDWTRLGLIFLASLLYIGVFLMLGLLVSSRTSRSTTALMMLLFIWVVIALAVPKVSMVIASKVHRVPSVQEVQADKDAKRSQILKEAQEEMLKYLAEGRQRNPSEAEAQAKIAEVNEKAITSITRETQKIQADYERSKIAQFRLAANISRTSPASVYTYAATGLARTYFDRQERFLAAARAYQPGFVQYFNEMMPKLMEQQAQQIRGQAVEKVKIDLPEPPKENSWKASLSESWNLVWVDFLILFLLLACFFMTAYVGFIRSDVR
jgi:ABC-type transport system involved in multi-copper enzyme maturation permease subunit